LLAASAFIAWYCCGLNGVRRAGGVTCDKTVASAATIEGSSPKTPSSGASTSCPLDAEKVTFGRGCWAAANPGVKMNASAIMARKAEFLTFIVSQAPTVFGYDLLRVGNR